MGVRKTFLPGLELGAHEWQEVPFQADPPRPLQPGQVVVGIDQLRDLGTLEWRTCRQLMPEAEFPDEAAFIEGMRPSAISQKSLGWMARPYPDTLPPAAPINARALVFTFDPERVAAYRPRWRIEPSVQPEDGLTFLIIGEVAKTEKVYTHYREGVFLCEASYYYERYAHRVLGGRVMGISGWLPLTAEMSPDRSARARTIASLALDSVRQFEVEKL